MKAIALFSGGLDSTLSMKLIRDQGIEVLVVQKTDVNICRVYVVRLEQNLK